MQGQQKILSYSVLKPLLRMRPSNLLYLVRIIQAVENVTKFGFYRDYLDCVIGSQTKIYGHIRHEYSFLHRILK